MELEGLAAIVAANHKEQLELANRQQQILSEGFTGFQKAIEGSLGNLTGKITEVYDTQNKNVEAILQEKEERANQATSSLSKKDQQLEEVRIQLEKSIKDTTNNYEQKLAEVTKLHNERYETLQKDHVSLKELYTQEAKQAENAIKTAELQKSLLSLDIIPELQQMIADRYSLKATIKATDSGKQVFIEETPINEFFSKWAATAEGKACTKPKASNGAVTAANTGKPSVSNEEESKYLNTDGTVNLTMLGKNSDSETARVVAARFGYNSVQ
jgi:hypothetical protein